ncbi:MAG: hypothetical protein AAF512_17695, partial [Pseudomonadota bacterium]
VETDFLTEEEKKAQEWAMSHPYWMGQGVDDVSRFKYLWQMPTPRGLRIQYEESIHETRHGIYSGPRRTLTAMERVTAVIAEQERQEQMRDDDTVVVFPQGDRDVCHWSDRSIWDVDSDKLRRRPHAEDLASDLLQSGYYLERPS